MEEVSRELVSNYKKMAEKFELASDEKSGDVQKALNYYEKCLKACQRAEMVQLEGQISHKIGMIYLKHGEFEKSIEHQKIYLNNAKLLDVTYFSGRKST
jgi:tetratricopeptide (TPR) repeat protein